MGVIILAFDGFEEIFAESSSGEAFSATDILVSARFEKRTSGGCTKSIIRLRKPENSREALRHHKLLFSSFESLS